MFVLNVYVIILQNNMERVENETKSRLQHQVDVREKELTNLRRKTDNTETEYKATIKALEVGRGVNDGASIEVKLIKAINLATMKVLVSRNEDRTLVPSGKWHCSICRKGGGINSICCTQYKLWTPSTTTGAPDLSQTAWKTNVTAKCWIAHGCDAFHSSLVDLEQQL